MKRFGLILLAVFLLVSIVSCATVKQLIEKVGPDDTVAPEETKEKTKPTETEKGPPTLKIDLPELPLVCRYGDEGEIEIIELVYDAELDEETERFDVYFEFKSVIVDTHGSTTFGFKWKLLQDGAVLKTSELSNSVSLSLDPGDVLNGTMSITNLPAGHYEVQIQDKTD